MSGFLTARVFHCNYKFPFSVNFICIDANSNFHTLCRFSAVDGVKSELC